MQAVLSQCEIPAQLTGIQKTLKKKKNSFKDEGEVGMLLVLIYACSYLG